MPAFFWAYKKSLAAFIIIFCLFPREEADCQPFPLLKRGSRLIAGIRRHQQRYEKRGFKFFGTTICYAFYRRRDLLTTIWPTASAARNGKYLFSANK